MGTETRVRPGSAPRRTRRGASTVWRATAASGVLLLLLVTVHMVAHHFVVESVGGLRTYEQVLDYLANPLILAVELAFLLVVTVHAMLGLRGVLFDLTGNGGHRAWIDRALVVLGFLTVGYGLILVLTLASRA